MKITIEQKNLYGSEVHYPACHDSRIFAKIAGTKTLTLDALREIEELGYEIELKQASVVDHSRSNRIIQAAHDRCRVARLS